MSRVVARSQHVLVVGWGFLGAAVGHRLLADGAVVTGLTRSRTLRTDRARDVGVHMILGDAADESLMERALAGVDHVVYAAGGLLPPAAAADPLEDALTTLRPLIHVLHALAERPAIALTYISSGGTVYGNPARSPVSETEPALPISAYGASRLAGEIYAQTHRLSLGRSVQVLRCANVYGPGQPSDRGQGAVAVFMDRVSAGLPVVIVGDGSAVRDYVYIDDVADAVVQLLDVAESGRTINIGSGVGFTVTQLLDLVATVVGRPAVVDHRPARPHDVHEIVLDISRLKAMIHFTPVPLAEGLRRTWEARSLAPAARTAVP